MKNHHIHYHMYIEGPFPTRGQVLLLMPYVAQTNRRAAWLYLARTKSKAKYEPVPHVHVFHCLELTEPQIEARWCSLWEEMFLESLKRSKTRLPKWTEQLSFQWNVLRVLHSCAQNLDTIGPVT